jgi:tripartite-type tricarboxylate transporter receptor subunit TctC
MNETTQDHRRLQGSGSGSRRAVLAAAGLATLLAAAPSFAADTSYPTKPITIVVPFAAGGSLDVTARVLAERLKDRLGQQVLILNKPGAGSALGAKAVASSPADGYTLFLASGSAFGYLHLLVKGFDLGLPNFQAIGSVATNTSLFAVSSASGIKSMSELVARAQAKPDSISFCSTGAGGLNHLQLEMFKRQVASKGGDFKVAHVPYNGVAPALTALRSGEVQACTLPYSALVKNLDGSEIKILAVQRATRIPTMPQTPTTGEQGYPGMDGNDALVNLSAPKGTPPEIIAKLEEALKVTMQDPATKRRLEELDVQPTFVNAKDTEKWLMEDTQRFSDIIRESGLAAAQ